VTADEAGRLAALERTLVGAAARRAERRPLRTRRVVAAAALAAPLIASAAAAMAGSGVFRSIERQLSTLSDDRPLTGQARLPGRPAPSRPVLATR
jgi:hypothetical protein